MMRSETNESFERSVPIARQIPDRGRLKMTRTAWFQTLADRWPHAE
jgi:hypothetical protein